MKTYTAKTIIPCYVTFVYRVEAENQEEAADLYLNSGAHFVREEVGETISFLDHSGLEIAEGDPAAQAVDPEPERQRRAAAKLRAALEYALEFLEANDDGEEDVTSRITAGNDAIAEAKAAGIAAETGAPGLLAVLQAVLPYAEGEAESLYELWKRDGDLQIKDASDRCARAIEDAHAAIARARAAGAPPAPESAGTAIGGQQSPRFEIEHNPEENP